MHILKRIFKIFFFSLKKKQSVDPVLYMVDWFMCVFCRTLPWSTVLRVWDMVLFCEGVKVLFKVAIVLVQNTIGRAKEAKQCESMYETLAKLKESFLRRLRRRVFFVRKGFVPNSFSPTLNILMQVLELELPEELLEKRTF